MSTAIWHPPFSKLLTFFFCVVALLSHELHAGYYSASTSSERQKFQYKSALEASQNAIDQVLSKHHFTDSYGRGVTSDTFLGKPLIISMVFTSCPQICPITIRHLSSVVEKARETLGEDSFSVLVIGFDTQFDSPLKMKLFAKKQSIDKKGWYALSADADTIAALTKELGFVYFTSPSGF